MAAVPSIAQGAWSKLRAKELKRLAFLCGQNVTGTKPEITKRLDRAIAVSPPKVTAKSGPVVLSIDLGLRNLAISLMTPTSASIPIISDSRKSKSKSKSKKKTSTTSPPSQSPISVTDPPSITLHHWERLALIAGSKDGIPTSEMDNDTDAAAPDEVFSPAEIAKLANGFLQKIVLQLNPLPTHILIERQRWRSGSARGIFEWTVRVNTLEAMLHASLRALRDAGVYQGEVISIRPEAVGKFFVSADEEEKKKPATKPSSNSKKLKIKALGRWLSDGKNEVIASGNELARDMIDAYKDRVVVTRRRRSTTKGEDMEDDGKVKIMLDTKLDDLTDSLMQGMAWLRWQENVAILRQQSGAETLLQAASQAIDESKMPDV
ncbi:mitochondrial resolvase Ydc2 [Xylaria arbuscula]|nr:mitochondrial resolvase Ydc2 [Xylaria arbuscula]